ncbi:MAG: hypothetical protein JNM41_04575 [Flavipsychrobacter sp.]|nr:hypothetical protein [Flavipsychrobacter sp.]
MNAPSGAERCFFNGLFVALGNGSVASRCADFLFFWWFWWFVLIISCLWFLEAVFASHLLPKTAQKLRTSSHPDCFRDRLASHPLLFFSFLQRRTKTCLTGRQGKRRLLPNRSAWQKVSSTLFRSSLCGFMAPASFLSFTRWFSYVPVQLLYFY